MNPRPSVCPSRQLFTISSDRQEGAGEPGERSGEEHALASGRRTRRTPSERVASGFSPPTGAEDPIAFDSARTSRWEHEQNAAKSTIGERPRTPAEVDREVGEDRDVQIGEVWSAGVRLRGLPVEERRSYRKRARPIATRLMTTPDTI